MNTNFVTNICDFFIVLMAFLYQVEFAIVSIILSGTLLLNRDCLIFTLIGVHPESLYASD